MFSYMNTTKPFSIVYVTYDSRRGAGGVVKEIQLAFKHYSKADGAQDAKQVSASENQSKRNPKHFSNSTVNIRIPGQDGVDIRKVHVQLIRRFNGAIVK